MYVLLERIEGLISIKLLVVLLHVYFNDLKSNFVTMCQKYDNAARLEWDLKKLTRDFISNLGKMSSNEQLHVKIQFNNNTLLAFICEYIFIILL